MTEWQRTIKSIANSNNVTVVEVRLTENEYRDNTNIKNEKRTRLDCESGYNNSHRNYGSDAASAISVNTS